MKFRIAVLLAGALALPALGFAQTTAPTAPAKPGITAPVKPVAPTRSTTTAKPIVAAPSGPVLIDVNSADEKTLDTLPGVGPARVKSIIANRPYTEKQQILEKKAVPSNVFAAIEDKIALANVNKTGAADLAKILPNVGPVRAQQIVDKRPYATLQDLVTKGALSQGILDGLKGLVTVGQ
ncbi:helix-hairpin-helix domain-containing protein [Acidisphaera sp. L21]|jgi:competence protein ComEA|uniref:helix-hairpin-helix domain-containing protein n=1 Tax=Acidisphaera sp. L21 TaxID=1641851 RepID=UPI00131BAF11|nr:helix-hairpin-helix domain-containing protein [Acidisphaera sp. L21]